jgi:hypothetical protein
MVEPNRSGSDRDIDVTWAWDEPARKMSDVPALQSRQPFLNFLEWNSDGWRLALLASRYPDTDHRP